MVRFAVAHDTLQHPYSTAHAPDCRSPTQRDTIRLIQPLFQAKHENLSMFEGLQDGLGSAFKTLRGKGKLSESNMRDGLKLVEKSLLEADVSFEVVRTFMQNVTEQAVGEKVLKSLNPD